MQLVPKNTFVGRVGHRSVSSSSSSSPQVSSPGWIREIRMGPVQTETRGNFAGSRFWPGSTRGTAPAPPSWRVGRYTRRRLSPSLAPAPSRVARADPNQTSCSAWAVGYGIPMSRERPRAGQGQTRSNRSETEIAGTSRAKRTASTTSFQGTGRLSHSLLDWLRRTARMFSPIIRNMERA